MSNPARDTVVVVPEPSEQSPGADPKSKRNSGLFAFFKWLKPSGSSRESIDSATSRSSSLDSLSSDKSAGTVASFSFVPPGVYEKRGAVEKCVQIGPETDTYRARLKQRDKRRESDKNVTLRKKYNLFFNRDSLLKPKKTLEDEENSKSLPLMTRAHIMEIEPEKVHRRTNSESSKVKRAGAYVHVKGKRRAPQPPGGGPNIPIDSSSTSSLKRKKRTAPIPPHKIETTENTDDQDKDIVANDYLKLDRGVLKPVKEETRPKTPQEAAPVPGFNAVSPSSSRTSIAEAPVSPRPWYKRNSGSREVLTKKENKYEPIERLPEVQYMRNSTLDLTLEDSLANPEKDKKKDDKRRSGMSFLTNISELDREASEIIKQKSELEKTDSTTNNLNEIPEFMKPKETKPTNDTLVSSKRRSTRDLIAKFNAITNVTKATVFGISHKDKYFGKQTSLDETKQRQEAILQNHKKRIEEIDKKKEDRFAPLMKSESASAVKLGPKPETPKMDRKSWKCPKCNLENEYWRIICHVCSAIKPYFDDFDKTPETKASSPVPKKKEEKLFERSKTQIGFSALSTYNANKKKLLENNDDCKVDETSKKEEREKLRKMLIEMKNSLPKRKSNILMKQNSRSSIIMENPVEETKKEIKQIEEEKEETNEEPVEKTQEEKVAEILIGTTKTIYQNIKVRKTSNPKPIKVSSEAQTSAVVRKLVPESSIKKLIENHKANNIYEPMKVQDFEDIYSDKNGKSAARLYANLAQNDELSLFFNVPKNISNLKNNLNNQKDGVSSLTQSNNNFNTDTIEINRLLRRLESAIAKGDMTEAAIFAKELAQLKVNCSVIRQKPQGVVVDAGKKIGFQIEMYVEDKVSHRGPFPIDVQESQTVLDLKEQIFREFEIPVDVQRWILGKELVTNDSATLKDHHITEGCPVFLYLVKPEKKTSGDQQNPTKSLNASTSKEIIDKNSKNENRLSAKINDIQIPVTVTQLDKNTEEIKTVLVNNKENLKTKDVEDTQHKLVAPKIINVIPKVTEKIPDRVEPAKHIPLQKETQKKSSSNANEKKTSTSTQIPVSVTEIKVDIRPQVSKILTSRVKEEKTGLVRAKVSEVKVLQAPPITVQSSKFTREVLPKTSKAVLSNGVENGREKIVEISVEVSKNSQQETKSSGGSSKVTGTSTSTNVNPFPKSPRTSSIYPNLSNLDDIGKTDAKVESKEAPKAKEEQDFEEYDSKTLKPPKEWECHLCTLLNPVSSNVCAVCATVRLKRTTLKRSSKKKPAPKPQEQTYLQLVTLDNADLVPNADAFECVVCFLEVDAKQGVTLRECLHQFCRECLSRTVEFAEDAEVKCPYRDEEYSCNIALQDREIKALVSADIYEQHLAKSVAQAENKMEKTFHCKTPDCKGWCIFEDNVNEFKCPVCRRTNCLTCQAIHIGLNCKQYQERMQNEADIDEDAKRTKDFLQEMVEKGEAIGCPTCKVILMKKWGCDWLRCSMCKTEICWVTRGPRWGPAGKGDTSGGCKCGINGVKCHPKCSYCH